MLSPTRLWIRRKVTPFNGLIVLFTVAFVAFFLFPFYWQVATSIRAPRNLTSIPPQLFPNPMYFERYVSIFITTQFPLNVRNSLIISSITTVTCLLFSILSSYAIARRSTVHHEPPASTNRAKHPCRRNRRRSFQACRHRRARIPT